MGLSGDVKSSHRKKREDIFEKWKECICKRKYVLCPNNESMQWYVYILNLASKHTLNKLDLREFPFISMKS